MDARPHIAIVGAGINGLCTAFHLLERGAAVTVIEAGRIPCPTAASSDHHRLIRPFYGAAQGYAARMPAAFDAWERLFAALPAPRGRYYAETGILCASREAGDYTDISCAGLDRIGEPWERIEGDAIARRFPFLEPGGWRYAALARGGALMADMILRDLADVLRQRGAVLMECSAATGIDPQAGRVTLAGGGVLQADRVIVAAGVATTGLLPDMALPVHPRRTIIVYADPPPDLAAAWAAAPGWNDLGGPTDFWGMPPVAGLPLKLGNGLMGEDESDTSRRAIGRAELEALRDSYRGLFRGAERFRIRWGQANYWTKAPEHRFLLSAQERALALSADSGHGFKFGALTGEDVAEAILGGDVAGVAARMAG